MGRLFSTTSNVSTPELLRNAYGESIPKQLTRLTRVVGRDFIYDLKALNPELDPTLAESVRASANFPFGFPLVRFPLATDLWSKHVDAKARELQLTDGGVLSNSGLWTLTELLMKDGAPGSAEHRMHATLKKRGVLLLMVDASKMPEYQDDTRDTLQLAGAISDQAPIGQNLHRNFLRTLEQEYGDKLQIVQVDLPPVADLNVHTTWALGTKAREQLARAFTSVWGKVDGCNQTNGTGQRRNVACHVKRRWKCLLDPSEDASYCGQLFHEQFRVPLD
jgi:hypothetical protein